jgi:hypothetical protein
MKQLDLRLDSSLPKLLMCLIASKSSSEKSYLGLGPVMYNTSNKNPKFSSLKKPTKKALYEQPSHRISAPTRIHQNHFSKMKFPHISIRAIPRNI